MAEKINRRSFMKKSVLASAATVAGLSYKNRGLSAEPFNTEVSMVPDDPVTGMPMGKIGNVKLSRLITGSNLFGGGAHSRDLLYVKKLMRLYHTPEKVMETMQLIADNGINTSVGGSGVKEFNEKTGGKIQFIGQLRPTIESAQKAIDRGAVGAFIWGNRSDTLVQNGQMEEIDKFITFVKKNGLIAGVGGHSYHVPEECEKAGIDVDFYFKTLHHDNYFSATPKEYRVDYAADHKVPTNHDNMFELYPEKTIEVMKSIKKPWIAYKVLAAGAIQPADGFKYVFENGADFICVGMMDFQILEDVDLTKQIVTDIRKNGRARPWCG
jgi:hypothetical protein